MKNSIGSLAALAAFAAPALSHATPPESDVRAADFENVTLSYVSSTPINFDIDGDSTTDFYIYANNSTSIRLFLNSPTQMTFGPVALGEVFETGVELLTTNTPIFSGFDGYYGFSFVSGVDDLVHAAWVHLDLSGATPVVVNGAWEAESYYQSITVGAIPEPSATAALAGAGALVGAFALRRRRVS